MNNGSPLPPQNLEAERAVLGGMALSPSAGDDVMVILGPEHFYLDRHAKLFSAMRDLYVKGKGVDVVTLGKEMIKRKQLEDVGGHEGIVEVLEAVPHAAHSVYYAEIVRDAADRRTCIQHATDILRASYDPGQNTEEAVATIEQSITALVESRARDTATTDLSSILMEAVSRLEAGHAKGIATGFSTLDVITTGMHAGQLIVVGARPRVGKTAFAMNVAQYVSEAIPTLYFSLEMSKLELSERMLACEAGISLYDMRTKRLDEQQQWELTESCNRLNSRKMFIDDDANRTLLQISSIARTMKRRHGIGLVIIDYLQLISARDMKVHREQQIAEMTRSLKCLAKSLSIPVMVLAQLNRESDKRSDNEPKLSDLRESGSIENDADQVWLLHRPVLYLDETSNGYDAAKTVAKVKVAKNRSGPAGMANMDFIEQFMRFRCEMPNF